MQVIVSRRRLVPLLVVLAVALLAVSLFVYFQRGLVPGDALVYRAAGERLNVGHQLYALMPGDQYIPPQPPYWMVPLLSPPLMGVIWRPLAALPGDSGAYLWWLGTMSSIGAVLLWLLLRRPALAAVAILVLDIPLTFEIGVGNVNGFLLLGTVATWVLISRRRDAAAGAIVAVMTALKVAPVLLLFWMLVERRWRAVGAFVAAGIGTLVISVAGAGLAAHFQYLGIARHTVSVGESTLSLAGIALTLGAPRQVADILPTAALLIGMGAVVSLRDRPGAAFSVAAATMVLGSPVININSYALLLAALAPLALPAADHAAGGVLRSIQAGADSDWRATQLPEGAGRLSR